MNRILIAALLTLSCLAIHASVHAPRGTIVVTRTGDSIIRSVTR